MIFSSFNAKLNFASLLILAFLGWGQTSMAMETSPSLKKTIWSINEIDKIVVHDPPISLIISAISWVDFGLWKFLGNYVGENYMGSDLYEWYKKGNLAFFLKKIKENPGSDVIPLQMANKQMFIINDIDETYRLLKNKEYVHKGDVFQHFADLVGTGLVSGLDIGKWTRDKGIILQIFARKNLEGREEFVQQVGKEIIQDHLNKEADLANLLNNITLVTYCRLVFNVDVKDMLGEISLASCFDECLRIAEVPPLFSWSKNFGAYAESRNKVYEWSRELIRRMRKNARGIGIDMPVVKKNDFVKALLLEEGEITQEMIQFVTMSVLAGHDTASRLLLSTIYTLLTTDEGKKTIEKIREEYDQRSDLEIDKNASRNRYIDRVHKEGLRLFAPGWAIPRAAQKDFTCGVKQVFVPKGSSIMFTVLPMQRDKKYFGNDAEEFRPDRFLETEEGKKCPPLLPFGLGSGACPGRNFADLSAVTLLELLFTQYDMEIIGEHEPRPHAVASFRLLDQLWVTITPRKTTNI